MLLLLIIIIEINFIKYGQYKNINKKYKLQLLECNLIIKIYRITEYL